MEPPFTLPACPKPKKVGVQLVLVRAVQIRCALGVTAHTDPLLHSTVTISTRRSTQQYISDPQRLIWVVVCLKNIMRKHCQVSDLLDNNKNETNRPKIRGLRSRHSGIDQRPCPTKGLPHQACCCCPTRGARASRMSCTICEELTRPGSPGSGWRATPALPVLARGCCEGSTRLKTRPSGAGCPAIARRTRFFGTETAWKRKARSGRQS